MKKLLIITVFITINVMGQSKSINNYKYIIVPKLFDFLNTPDKYQTSSLTKFLFNKYGFKAFLSDENLPEDLRNNRCLALTADVKDKSGFLTTKNSIELNDYYNKNIFTSQEGMSKEKNYKKAYHGAIRKAFKSIQALKYKYSPKNEMTELVIGSKSKPSFVENKNEKTGETTTNSTLYAQPVSNGFQLINSKPEIVFQILRTGIKDVFIVKKSNGIFYKKDNSWIHEYYETSEQFSKKYNVKF